MLVSNPPSLPPYPEPIRFAALPLFDELCDTDGHDPDIIELVMFVDKIREHCDDVAASGIVEPWLHDYLLTAKEMLLSHKLRITEKSFNVLNDRLQYFQSIVEAATQGQSDLDEDSLNRGSNVDTDDESDDLLPTIYHDAQHVMVRQVVGSDTDCHDQDAVDNCASISANKNRTTSEGDRSFNLPATEQKVAARQQIRDRDALFGVHSADGDIRRREVGPKPDKAIDEDEIAENMLSLVRTLRDHSHAASSIIGLDVQTMANSSEVVQLNATRLNTEMDRLNRTREQIGCRCWIVFILVSVTMIFLVMVWVIRLSEGKSD